MQLTKTNKLFATLGLAAVSLTFAGAAVYKSTDTISPEEQFAKASACVAQLNTVVSDINSMYDLGKNQMRTFDKLKRNVGEDMVIEIASDPKSSISDGSTAINAANEAKDLINEGAGRKGVDLSIADQSVNEHIISLCAQGDITKNIQEAQSKVNDISNPKTTLAHYKVK